MMTQTLFAFQLSWKGENVAFGTFTLGWVVLGSNNYYHDGKRSRRSKGPGRDGGSVKIQIVENMPSLTHSTWRSVFNIQTRALTASWSDWCDGLYSLCLGHCEKALAAALKHIVTVNPVRTVLIASSIANLPELLYQSHPLIPPY